MQHDVRFQPLLFRAEPGVNAYVLPERKIAVLDGMIQLARRGGGFPAILSTHPAPQDRIEAIEALIPEAIRAAEA